MNPEQRDIPSHKAPNPSPDVDFPNKVTDEEKEKASQLKKARLEAEVSAEESDKA